MWGPPQIRFFAYYMGGGGAQVSFFAYYRRPPQISLFAYYMVLPSGRFLHLLYVGAPLDMFFRLLYGPTLRSVSSLTICPPPPDQFLCLLCWGPSRSVYLHIYYIGGPLRSVSSLTIGGPLSSVSSHNTSIWGPPQINFFAYYMGAPWINFFNFYMGAP